MVQLLPGLFLGRVDGKSPAEYLNDERGKEQVRRVARRLPAAAGRSARKPARCLELRTQRA